jgi:nitroreductase
VKWLVLYERSDVETVARHVADWMRYMLANHPAVAAQFNMQKILDDVEQGVDRICRQAPHLIFAFIGKEVGVGAADCHTALAYLELILPSLGGGSCWAGYVTFAASQWPPLAEFLGLSEDIRLHGAVMAGIPKFRYHRIPPRNLPDIRYR